MSKSVYPRLLSERARIFASFSRGDVVTLGSAYLILSSFKISTLPMSFILICIYALKITVLSKIEPRFFRNLFSPKDLYYRDTLRRLYDKK
jgi:hypothetical protein